MPIGGILKTIARIIDELSRPGGRILARLLEEARGEGDFAYILYLIIVGVATFIAMAYIIGIISKTYNKKGYFRNLIIASIISGTIYVFGAFTGHTLLIISTAGAGFLTTSMIYTDGESAADIIILGGIGLATGYIFITFIMGIVYGLGVNPIIGYTLIGGLAGGALITLHERQSKRTRHSKQQEKTQKAQKTVPDIKTTNCPKCNRTLEIICKNCRSRINPLKERYCPNCRKKIGYTCDCGCRIEI